uniref:Uncharacterized protein n=1 Tax=Oryza nivara TaxID=4536 RepID=A0A0E0GF64_ORYNI
MASPYIIHFRPKRNQESSDALVMPLIARVVASGRISPSLFNEERKWRPDSSDEDVSTSRKDLRFAKFGASSEELNVREIHSRKPQHYRTRISEEFRDSSRLILVGTCS